MIRVCDCGCERCPGGTRCARGAGCVCFRSRQVTRSRKSKTGLQTLGCYAAGLYDCDGGSLTREDYFSKSIQQFFFGLLGDLKVTTPDGTTPLDPGRMAPHILCKRHNNALSPLDDEALRLAPLLWINHPR